MAIKNAAEGNLKVGREKWLLVGLGNPGRQYKSNRHNVGFMLIDRLAERFDITLGRAKMRSLVGSGLVGESTIVLAKPKTMMNRSGDSVGALANYLDIRVDHVVAIYDDIDLPLGTIRLRQDGGSGGHNGMRSIIAHIGNGFPRLRLGVDRPPGRMDAADYVLQDFGKIEADQLEIMLEKAADAIEAALRDGMEIAISRFNGPAASRADD